jgi:hypothetical protein
LKKTIFVCAAGLGLMVGCATPSAQQRMARSQAVEAEVAAQAEAETETETEEMAVAGQRPGDKLICENAPPAGSRFPRTVCRTARDLEQERDTAQRFLRDGQRTPRFQ